MTPALPTIDLCRDRSIAFCVSRPQQHNRETQGQTTQPHTTQARRDVGPQYVVWKGCLSVCPKNCNTQQSLLSEEPPGPCHQPADGFRSVCGYLDSALAAEPAGQFYQYLESIIKIGGGHDIGAGGGGGTSCALRLVRWPSGQTGAANQGLGEGQVASRN